MSRGLRELTIIRNTINITILIIILNIINITILTIIIIINKKIVLDFVKDYTYNITFIDLFLLSCFKNYLFLFFVYLVAKNTIDDFEACSLKVRINLIPQNIFFNL